MKYTFLLTGELRNSLLQTADYQDLTKEQVFTSCTGKPLEGPVTSQNCFFVVVPLDCSVLSILLLPALLPDTSSLQVPLLLPFPLSSA